MTILPLRTAGEDKTFFIDSYISSYTPTLKAHIAVRQEPPQSSSTHTILHPNLLVVSRTKSSDLDFAAKEPDVMLKLGLFVANEDDAGATRTSILECQPSYD